MPKYSFNFWEETKWGVVFEADNLEHAKELMEETLNVDDLPNVEKFFKKGDETWDTETLQEEKGEK
jgi:hypothetical protein